jgi:hypothetical protein
MCIASQWAAQTALHSELAVLPVMASVHSDALGNNCAHTYACVQSYSFVLEPAAVLSRFGFEERL